jgi:hypothetical protein
VKTFTVICAPFMWRFSLWSGDPMKINMVCGCRRVVHLLHCPCGLPPVIPSLGSLPEAFPGAVATRNFPCKNGPRALAEGAWWGAQQLLEWKARTSLQRNCGVVHHEALLHQCSLEVRPDPLANAHCLEVWCGQTLPLTQRGYQTKLRGVCCWISCRKMG